MFNRFGTLALVICLAACSSVSKKAPPPAPFKIVTGITTRQEISAHFGDADCIATKDDGTKIYEYMFARPKSAGPGAPFLTVKNYAPWMSLLSRGRLSAEYWTISVEFSAADIVTNQSSKISVSISQPSC